MSFRGSGGRDIDKHRKYNSGAAKRKAREEREARESEVLSKVPKISELFFPESNAAIPTIPSTETYSAPIPPELTATFLTSDDPSSSNSYSFDLGLWPVNVSDSMREYWAAKGSGQCNNSDADFSASSTRFEGEKYNRQCQKSLFTYTHQLTKQQHPRAWLCYSTSEHAVYCFACKLMTHVSVFGKQGYKDWKRASQAIPSHEISSAHREAMVQLSERGLAFMGSDEVVGSSRNGNYT